MVGFVEKILEVEGKRSDQTEPFGAFRYRQKKSLFELLIRVVIRQAELVETKKKRII